MKFAANYYGLASACIFLFTGCWLLMKSCDQPLGDYANYYCASWLLLEKEFDDQVYEPFLFNRICNERAPGPVFVNYTPVPPASAIFYLPFAGLKDALLSKFLFSLIGLLLFSISYYRLIRYFGIQANWGLLFAPMVFFTPFQNNILQGQSYLYLLACLMEGFRQWDQKRPLTAGILWAIPITLKIYPGILILFLLFRNDRRILFSTIGFSILFSLLPLAFFSPQITADYFLQILPRLFKGEINDPFSHFHQSAAALLNKLFAYDRHLNPLAPEHQPLFNVGLTWLYQISVLSAVFLLWSSEKTTVFFRFSMAFLAAFLLVSYGSTYSLMFLLLLFIAWLLQKNQALRMRVGLTGLLALALNVPVYLLTDLNLILQFPRLFALLTVFLISAVLIRPRFEGKTVVFTTLIILFKGLLSDFPKPAEGAYYLEDNRYGIIYGYEFKDHQLSLIHLNEKGLQNTVIVSRDSIWQDPDLCLKNGQVFFQNRQITHSASRKRQPFRLNQNEIIYLSDEKRGVGFYTLWRLEAGF